MCQTCHLGKIIEPTKIVVIPFGGRKENVWLNEVSRNHAGLHPKVNVPSSRSKLYEQCVRFKKVKRGQCKLNKKLEPIDRESYRERMSGVPLTKKR